MDFLHHQPNPEYAKAVDLALSWTPKQDEVISLRARNMTGWYLMTLPGDAPDRKFMFPPERLQHQQFPTIPERKLIRGLYDCIEWTLRMVDI